jgi:hypothetical protein
MEPHELQSAIPEWTLLRQAAFALGFGEVIRMESATDKSSDISLASRRSRWPKHVFHISAFGETSPAFAGKPPRA